MFFFFAASARPLAIHAAQLWVSRNRRGGGQEVVSLSSRYIFDTGPVSRLEELLLEIPGSFR